MVFDTVWAYVLYTILPHPHTVPPPPGTLTVTTSTPHTLSLSWEPSSGVNGSITAYTIRVMPTDQEFNVSGNVTTVEVVGLTPYTVYMVSVSASTSACEGDAVTITNRTAEDGT